MLSRPDLFARLAQGHAARITVVTPNRRLSQALQSDFDEFQVGRGLAVWEAPDILPFDAFVARLWEEALCSPIGETSRDELPLLLTGAQEQRLWEEILAGSGLLAIPQAAAQCREAWRLAHLWRLAPGAANEDARAFSEWSKIYSRRTGREIDAARLPDLMSGLLEKLKKPALLVAYGFDIVPPQTRELLARFETAHCGPEAQDAAAVRASFPSAREELEAAAKWARARLEAGRGRIGVVVPGLTGRRQEVLRVFARVMGARQPFNVSVGEPLAAYPLVDAALSILSLSLGEVAFAAASRLIRSRFLGGAETEMARRATLDARMRRDAGAALALPQLTAAAQSCPLLRRRLEALFALPRPGEQSPGAWARHFSALLEAAGFPGERAPDSQEFQTLAKWHEALAEFAKLERVTKAMAFGEALACLKRLCGDTLFQPETPQAPVQILGILESAGLRFDCLWVSGLTDEAWPLHARPNPFLPIAAQKAAGIPQASAEASLEFDRRITAQWRAAAGEVVFSYPLRDKDRDLAPSPLILGIEHAAPAVPQYPSYRDLLFQSKHLSSFDDAKGPAVKIPQVRGGTRVLADQAACPFRAFARWRLGAEALEEPAPGLDARDRGVLLHALMKHLWGELKASHALRKDTGAAIERAAEAAIREVGLEGGFAALERERLPRLAREWLELEKTRKGFEVVAVEEKRTLAVAGLEFSARLDRMDRLADGEHVLIDYKSGGNPGPRLWEGPRPDEPQLPLYALAAPERLGAVAFAKVRPGDMKFLGFSSTEKLVPGVKAVRDWPGLLAIWKNDAEALGAGFAAGDARVDPKDALKTCRLCDLQTLCRVYEKNLSSDEPEAG